MADRHRDFALPAGLPVPVDDGACDHLWGRALPSIPLRSTDGGVVDLARRPGLTVVFTYPRTGRAEEPESPEWNAIPGARGCTPQTCGFRDLHADLRAYVDAIFGLSTQTTEYQREAVGRLHLPFALLSDSGLVFTRALRLPTFEFTPYESQNPVHLKRMAFILQDGRITAVFYPVFPPDRNASDVLNWVATERSNGR
jgi:peroxiredoxin